MNHILNATLLVALIVAFAAGLALGAFYFIALWHTLQRLPAAHSPARLMLVSFVLRMAVVMVGFYSIMGGEHWERLVAAMLGFIIIRKILTHLLGPQKMVEEVRCINLGR
ncbi:sodium-transporting atpase subunit r [hydrocarbon metagenome]|uniref:Sodium-transporting atpase subunit r n=1 Tax=hydrocarbon metagenome TaxID=938273 RepID=A0A0W8FN13_9ZZZZ